MKTSLSFNTAERHLLTQIIDEGEHIGIYHINAGHLFQMATGCGWTSTNQGGN